MTRPRTFWWFPEHLGKHSVDWQDKSWTLWKTCIPYIWRKSDKAFQKNNIIPRVKHDGDGVMGWDCFAASRCGRLDVINGSINSAEGEHLAICWWTQDETNLGSPAGQWSTTEGKHVFTQGHVCIFFTLDNENLHLQLHCMFTCPLKFKLVWCSETLKCHKHEK